ncbi:LuxR family transcriptional regulator [Tranquillimonas rosea]|uniref:LuxR family transcriptional regulator n=1 Tax=Tranquillimonas rosea TaxID=641238 RepID=A0A1H9X6Q1_9RHOB|nr:autoinducer binding domain-containing protein [Tranquillimonas rosea]SES41749.1 LuxR family transcriptional regulator [Tranquillimonas rosea]
MFERSEFDHELRKLDAHAEAGYFVGLHIRFTSPLLAFQTYNEAWAKHYNDNGYVLRDPMTAWSFSTTGSTRWSNKRIPDPFRIFDQAARFGLKYGATISHGPISSRSVASVARSDRELTDAEIEDCTEILHRLHEMSEPGRRLTAAQRDALKCIADGHRHAAAAAKLNISESALKLRLSAARERLLARTTAEAVQRAKDLKLL